MIVTRAALEPAYNNGHDPLQRKAGRLIYTQLHGVNVEVVRQPNCAQTLNAFCLRCT
jgi:hypothetical protein